MANPNQALDLIIKERIRQTLVEGYSLGHDDDHTDGQLAWFAAAYALSSSGNMQNALELVSVPMLINWEFKPKDPIMDLVRAGALILAELERIIRKEK